jgi:ethanolamine ammonia-lyase large subunit
MAVRLQPNHPTADRAGITAAILDGLLYGCGDAVIGINPASDSIATISALVDLLDQIIRRFDIPTQACVLTHVTTDQARRPRCANRPHVPIGGRNAGCQCGLRDRPRDARGGA